MTRLPIVEGIQKYLEEENIYFCMPGHKKGRGFISTEEGKRIYNNFIKGDITEVDGVDNLHDPKEMIKEAQDLLSEYYGSNKSYFLINGSTSGNLAMIFSTFNEGDKIIIERNCHKSIYNGIMMRKLKPLYIKNKIDSKLGIPLSFDEEYLIELINENKDAKGIILTYPNYYGICSDLNKLIDIAHKNNMKILVDSAHGAHFGACDNLPHNAVEMGADMVVMSAHKTLPSLTQTAYLHVNSENIDVSKVDFYVSALSSTSPSYIFMASMDYARFYLNKYGQEQYTNLIEICNKYKNKINGIKGLKVIDVEDINHNQKWRLSIDKSRFIINVENGYSGHKLLNYLRSHRIQAEMSDDRNVILIFSPFNTEQEFERLYEVLENCSLEDIIEIEVNNLINNIDIPNQKLYPYEVLNREKNNIDIDKAIGKISAQSIIPYPPGVPLVMPGEILNREIIEYIKKCLENNMTILGMKNRQISIIKDEEK